MSLGKTFPISEQNLIAFWLQFPTPMCESEQSRKTSSSLWERASPLLSQQYTDIYMTVNKPVLSHSTAQSILGGFSQRGFMEQLSKR